MDESQFPSNSQRRRPQENRPEKRIEKVVQGEVVRRKVPITKRFSNLFFNGDPKGAVKHVSFDILAPAARDAVLDAFHEMVDQTFGGGRSHRRRSRGYSNGPYINYSRYSDSRREDPRDREQRPRMSQRGRANFDFGEIVLDSRVEAEEVVDQLFEIVSKYESATVADLYNLVGINPEYTDRQWGWTDIQGAGVTRVRGGGYLVDVPRPEPLE